ncbi:peroxidase family 2 domain protein [Rhizoctonia solani AG-3 Rhs1AP]|uniref:Peroxidase family 2 domain protein n=1 Tax=Rhizoctonia solani AG-3 Rhs1AP TaxID=1086054 RepID=X8IWW7_9AGAM|nr:peroxidase family 2 domain protein [Rhizoctonia solani AG-3 Rhs1AP]
MVLASLSKAIYDAGVSIGFLLYLLGWDLGLHIANVIRPRKQVGSVVVVGLRGQDGSWGEFRPPRLGDARSPCPALNALANHGIIPRNGRGITWKELGEASQKAYNLAPTLCKQVPWLTAKFLFAGRDWNETMTLDDLNAHGAIEHDASYTRADIKWQHDQGVPDYEIIQGLYESAGLDIDNLKPKDKFTLEDLSNYLAYRRAHSKAFNGQYIMNKNGKTFGSINSAMAHIAFDGNAADLKTWLLEERIPDGWEPKNRSRHGVTIKQLNGIASQIEKGIARAGNLEARVLKNGAGKHMHRDKIEFDTDRH